MYMGVSAYSLAYTTRAWGELDTIIATDTVITIQASTAGKFIQGLEIFDEDLIRKITSSVPGFAADCASRSKGVISPSTPSIIISVAWTHSLY